MTDINSTIDSYISKRRLRDAFRELRSHASRLGDWRVTDRIDHLEQNYSMMLKYAVQGADDPSRADVYGSIVAGIYDVLDYVNRELARPRSSSLYFGIVRYEQSQSDNALSDLSVRYVKALADTSIYNLVETDNASAVEQRAGLEALERRIFNNVWTRHPFTAEDDSAVRRLLTGEEVPEYFKEMLISALLLALTSYYDERKLNVLLDMYASGSSSKLRIRALCAALMAMFVNRMRIDSVRMRDRVAALRDTTDWSRDVRSVLLQFIRSRDTERITRKMNDELLPEMMKLRPDIARRMKNSDALNDMAGFEENPEWQELLDKSGLSDKLKELTKMQEDGGDVLMSTFANLKSFPFFNDVANWFVPFHPDHTSVTRVLGKDLESIGSLISSSPFLCDGDKYSFVFAVASVPESQRKLMLSQMDAQMMNELELKAASMSTSADMRDNIANKYVQDLYRFFKLYRRRGEFNDPFARPLNLLQLPLLAPDFTDSETLAVVGEFYFKRGYYDDALKVFSLLADMLPPDVQLYQKMGYCMQNLGNPEEAIKYYSQAELLNADSLWTLRRLAACYKMLDRPSKALEYYKRIERLKPDDLSVALSIGHCLLELNRPAEAINYYFKVEFVDDKSTRAWRPIAWASFVTGDLERSRNYYERILTDAPTATDYLNMGHVYLASHDMKEAVNYYNLSIDNDNNDIETFINNFNSDARHLVNAGVDASLLPLVIDTILYSRD